MVSPLGSVVGISHARASGLLLEQVSAGFSIQSFLPAAAHSSVHLGPKAAGCPLLPLKRLDCLAWRYLGTATVSEGSRQFSRSGPACCRPGRVMALSVLMHTHTHNAIETKENLVNPQKSRFLSNLAAFVHEPLGIEVASDLLPAPA